MRNLMGISLRRTSKVRKARDPETERKAEEKRDRKRDAIRRNRELGAFTSYWEPRGVPTQAAWPGGRERRESEMARIAARAEQEQSVPFGQDMKACVTDEAGNLVRIVDAEIVDAEIVDD